MYKNFSVVELPGLPFHPDVASAAAWRDRLPVGNTSECCRLMHQTLTMLRTLPLEPRLRLDLLETCRPAIFGLVYAMTVMFVGKPYPLMRSTRRLAFYCLSVHMETAAIYRGLVQSKDFIILFERDERANIVARALDHLGHALLKISQIYEVAPREIWLHAIELYAYAEKNCILDDGAATGQSFPATPRTAFQRMRLFAIAAPWRLGQTAMQLLFERLAPHPVQPSSSEASSSAAGVRFWFESARPSVVIPVLAGVLPPKNHFIWAAGLCSGVRAAFPQAAGDELAPVLPRLGHGPECPEDRESRAVELIFGIKAVAMTLRFLESRRFHSAGTDYWPRLHGLEFNPLDEAVEEKEEEEDEDRLLVTRTDKNPPPAIPDKQTVEIVATELPGYYLANTGEWPLRAGFPVGIGQDDWIRIGVVRGGQPREGRLWHSIEVFGAFPRMVNVRDNDAMDGFRTGFLLDEQESGGGTSLIVPPVRWLCEDTIRVDEFREKKAFRIGRLLEITADFCHFELLGEDARENSRESAD